MREAIEKPAGGFAIASFLFFINSGDWYISFVIENSVLLGAQEMIDVRKKLQDELNAIEHELRVELPKEILRARELGDLSENAEYKSAKERQSYLEGRKAQLQQRLAALSLVNMEKIPVDRAAYGSKVTLYDYETEKEIEYRLVSPEESDVSRGLISISSPIGRSISGKMVGDTLEIVTPSGRREYELRSLLTIHELDE